MSKQKYNIGDIVAYSIEKGTKVKIYGRFLSSFEYVKQVGKVIQLDGNLYIVRNIVTNNDESLTTKRIAGLASQQSIDEYELAENIEKFNI